MCTHTHGHGQLCPTLCNPMDCSLPDCSIQEISQAIKLEWVAVSSSRERRYRWPWFPLEKQSTCLNWMYSVPKLPEIRSCVQSFCYHCLFSCHKHPQIIFSPQSPSLNWNQDISFVIQTGWIDITYFWFPPPPRWVFQNQPC